MSNNVITTCRVVRYVDFSKDWYRERIAEMGHTPVQHRKYWEWAAIVQVMEQYILNAVGDTSCYKALGFGVGEEPITAWLANRQVYVTATDYINDQGGKWKGQHAKSLSVLSCSGTGPVSQFLRYARLDNVDMRAIPIEYLAGEFDFVWSAGSLEHIGGLAAGIRFILNSMRCLRPGGLAIHTTEYNYLSRQDTIDADDLCLYRKVDLERLAVCLGNQGDELWELDLSRGNTEWDIDSKYVLNPPYEGSPHISIRINDRHVTTSILLVAQRKMLL